MEGYMKTISLSKILFTFVALTIIFTAGLKAYGEQNVEDVDYEKWSRIALSAVKEKYPEAQLVDYKYVKREAVNEEESKDVFHVKLKQKDEQFVANVDVVFNPKTGKLITVNIEKVEDAPSL
jgi:FKBP-type peptidyl-prolyl cis-trans isomerase (trigger factor)